MRLREKIALLIRIDAFIRRKATGSPEAFAARLSISRPTLNRYMNELRYFGAPVDYCRYRQSYYYTEDYELSFDMKW